MKADLRGVTLTIIETRCHELARLAILDCLDKAIFEDVLYFSDQNPHIPGVTWIETVDAPSKLAWAQYFWQELPKYVRTPQTLHTSWDAWIVNPGAWDNRFLDYDLIGAPWWYEDDHNVGNTGFAIRSRKLIQFLANNRATYPVTTDAEDDLLCRTYRPRLEDEHGFRWAPESLALQFAFEYKPPTGVLPFGYHAMRNWVYVMGREALIERVKVAVRCPHVCTPHHLGFLLRLAPWLRDEVKIPAF